MIDAGLKQGFSRRQECRAASPRPFVHHKKRGTQGSLVFDPCGFSSTQSELAVVRMARGPNSNSLSRDAGAGEGRTDNGAQGCADAAYPNDGRWFLVHMNSKR